MALMWNPYFHGDESAGFEGRVQTWPALQRAFWTAQRRPAPGCWLLSSPDVDFRTFPIRLDPGITIGYHSFFVFQVLELSFHFQRIESGCGFEDFLGC